MNEKEYKERINEIQTKRDYYFSLNKEQLDEKKTEFFKKLSNLRRKINSLERKIDNPKTYTNELYDKHTSLLKEKLFINAESDLIHKIYNEKGYLIVEV